MITKEEAIVLLTSALVIGYVMVIKDFSLSSWVFWFYLSVLMLAANFLGKKIIARFFDSDVEIKHWTVLRYGFWENMRFKKPFPAWIVFPLIVGLATGGFVKWLAGTTFEATPLASKARHKFGKMTETDLALIVLGGILVNILVAYVSQLLGYTDFARFNLLFSLISLIPLSDLDGSKVFFGSKFLWIFSIVFVLAILILLDMAGILPAILTALLLAVAAVSLFYFIFES